jgi:single-strand DNA-binding protein
MNIVNLVGRIGRDPEIKTFDNGNKIAQFSLATSEKWKDKTTGEKKERTQWHQIKVQGDGLVGVVENWVKKGDMLAVTGSIEYREYEKDGIKRIAPEIIIGMKGGLYLISSGSADRAPSEPTKSAEPARTFAEDLEDDLPF